MACTKDNLHDKQTRYVYRHSSEPMTMQLTVQAVTTDRRFICPRPKPHTFTRLWRPLCKAFKIQASDLYRGVQCIRDTSHRPTNVISYMAVLLTHIYHITFLAFVTVF